MVCVTRLDSPSPVPHIAVFVQHQNGPQRRLRRQPLQLRRQLGVDAVLLVAVLAALTQQQLLLGALLRQSPAGGPTNKLLLSTCAALQLSSASGPPPLATHTCNARRCSSPARLYMPSYPTHLSAPCCCAMTASEAVRRSARSALLASARSSSLDSRVVACSMWLSLLSRVSSRPTVVMACTAWRGRGARAGQYDAAGRLEAELAGVARHGRCAAGVRQAAGVRCTVPTSMMSSRMVAATAWRFSRCSAAVSLAMTPSREARSSSLGWECGQMDYRYGDSRTADACCILMAAISTTIQQTKINQCTPVPVHIQAHLAATSESLVPCRLSIRSRIRVTSAAPIRAACSAVKPRTGAHSHHTYAILSNART